jgi:serine phosphatase RsbU (regulator of sigma subunit)
MSQEMVTAAIGPKEEMIIETEIHNRRTQLASNVIKYVALGTTVSVILMTALGLFFPQYPQLLVVASFEVLMWLSSWPYPVLCRRGWEGIGIRFFLFSLLFVLAVLFPCVPELMSPIILTYSILIITSNLLLGAKGSLWLVVLSTICLLVDIVLIKTVSRGWFPPLAPTIALIFNVLFIPVAWLIIVRVIYQIVAEQDDYYRQSRRDGMEIKQRIAIEQEQRERLQQANLEIKALNERLKDENLRMAAELEVTRQLQQMILPTEDELRQVEGLDIAGFMEPADEVGGDYYDVLQHDGKLKIGIGDVTGHGLESGVVMLMLQTAVRTLLTSGEKDPVRFMDVLNRTLHDNMRRMNVDKSLTLALLDYACGYTDRVGKLYLSGQHEYLIVMRRDGRAELVDTLDLGLPVGLVTGIADFVGELSVELGPGDGVVLYSDGFTEAENEAGEFYGLERLCAVVSQHWAGSAEEIKEAVVRDAREFIGGQMVYDDLTLLVIKQR